MQPQNNQNQPPPGGTYRPRIVEPPKPGAPGYEPPAPPLAQSPTVQPNTPPNHERYSVPPASRRNRGGRWSSVVSTLLLLILAPVIAVSIAAFVVQSYQVDGQSMETTLQNNDRLIVNKWPRTWARVTSGDFVPDRGKIIVFNQVGLDYLGGGSKQLIKRVIGLPGERVLVKDGKITVYNDQHPAGYDPDTSGDYEMSANVTPGDTDVILADNEIFVCGDNRVNSEDSRYFGPVKLDQIIGELAFRVVPLSKAQRF